jgi:ribonuclease J
MYEKESDDLMRMIKIMLKEDFDKYQKSALHISDLHNIIKKRLRNYLYQETKRNPVVLPVIIEV